MKVYYLGYYDLPDHGRSVSPAAVTMMDYVSSAIQQTGIKCIILSPTISRDRKPMERIELEDGREVFFAASYGTASKTNIVKRIYLRVRRQMELYRMLDSQLQEGDILLVYHSLAYIDVLRRLRRRKQFTLLLQVCEIYADVLENKRRKKKELKWISEADAYMFSTKQLEHSINKNNKLSQVCLGTYKVEDSFVEECDNDKSVHVVYAGTFDPRKGGAQAAAAAAYLPAGYHVHIIGFGTEEEVSSLKNQIKGVCLSSQCKVTYDGCLSGNEYLEFIQRCDIGLCPQDPTAAFNATSFPSKILSYMSNGLHVVSARVSVIEDSPVGDLIEYYDVQTPEEIAKAILKIDIKSKGKEQERVAELDKSFQKDVKSMLNQLFSKANEK